jgi:outer membrane protein OmpA-like peptidoglycan-associated protein
MDEDGVLDRVDNCVNTPKGCVVDQWGCDTDADGDGVCDGIDQCPNTAHGDKVDKNGCSQTQLALKNAPASAPAPKPAPAAAPVAAAATVSAMEKQLVEGGKIRLENVYFESGSDHLLPESESSLDEAGQTLEKFPTLKLEVQGHTDTRGSAKYNMRLSQQRAEAVRRFLLDHFHLNPDQVRAKGYGESDPETRERNEEELLRNRRVVIEVLNPEALPHGVKVENKP